MHTSHTAQSPRRAARVASAALAAGAFALAAIGISVDASAATAPEPGDQGEIVVPPDADVATVAGTMAPDERHRWTFTIGDGNRPFTVLVTGAETVIEVVSPSGEAVDGHLLQAAGGYAVTVAVTGSPASEEEGEHDRVSYGLTLWIGDVVEAATAPVDHVVQTPIAVERGEPRGCGVHAVAADTGETIHADVVQCRAGWAVVVNCPPPAPGTEREGECEDFTVFELGRDRWELNRTTYFGCAVFLAEATGMSPHTAVAFQPTEVCLDEELPARQSVAPGSSGDDVAAVQRALVAVGYDLAIDGEFGPRTEWAVRDFQTRHGLDADGVADPLTQAALGM